MISIMIFTRVKILKPSGGVTSIIFIVSTTVIESGKLKFGIGGVSIEISESMIMYF